MNAQQNNLSKEKSLRKIQHNILHFILIITPYMFNFQQYPESVNAKQVCWLNFEA